jgi:dCTP deaminase
MLCLGEQVMIYPFHDRSVVAGKSFGLGPCTYDVRIAENVRLKPRGTALASTIERFNMPENVCAHVMDKSSWAREFVSCYNTHIDPGWCGFLTLELRNDTDEEVLIVSGCPIVQIKFEWLDQPTDRPYRGKYQNQEAGPQPARKEN